MDIAEITRKLSKATQNYATRLASSLVSVTSPQCPEPQPCKCNATSAAEAGLSSYFPNVWNFILAGAAIVFATLLVGYISKLLRELRQQRRQLKKMMKQLEEIKLALASEKIPISIPIGSEDVTDDGQDQLDDDLKLDQSHSYDSNSDIDVIEEDNDWELPSNNNADAKIVPVEPKKDI